jgi:hypothetical protein
MKVHYKITSENYVNRNRIEDLSKTIFHTVFEGRSQRNYADEEKIEHSQCGTNNTLNFATTLVGEPREGVQLLTTLRPQNSDRPEVNNLLELLKLKFMNETKTSYFKINEFKGNEFKH